MKKIFTALFLALIIASVTACSKNANVPVSNSGSANTSSGSQAAVSSSEQTPNQNIKADSSSVTVRMPSEVRVGETATATIENNSSYEISYGAEYTFEYLKDGEWVALKPLQGKERMWIAIAYITQPGEEATFDFVIYPDEFTSPLEPGEYRIVKSIHADNGGEAASFEITGNFTIK